MTSERESLAKEWDWRLRPYSMMSDSEKDELAQRFGFDSFYDYVTLDTSILPEPIYAGRYRSNPNLIVDDKKWIEIIENLEKDLQLFQDLQLESGFGKRKG